MTGGSRGQHRWQISLSDAVAAMFVATDCSPMPRKILLLFTASIKIWTVPVEVPLSSDSIRWNRRMIAAYPDLKESLCRTYGAEVSS